MLKHIVFISSLIVSSAVSASPWYRQFYGHYSFGLPVDLERGFSSTFLDEHKTALSTELKIKRENITYLERYSESLRAWYGPGYRFTSGYSIEINRFHIETSKYYKCYKHWMDKGRFDQNKFLDKEESTLNLDGALLTGKIYTRTFRFFRATPKTNSLVWVPASVKTEHDLEHYLNAQNTRKTGWLHTFNFYLQGGIGYCGGRQVTEIQTGDDYTKERKENHSKCPMPITLTIAGGVGGQYYLSSHLSVDGALLYIVPLRSAHTEVHPFCLFKIGANVYL